MISDLLKGLTEEQIEKIKECKKAEEIIALAKAEGVELTEDQLQAVSGGGCSAGPCRFCGSNNTELIFDWGIRGLCHDCGEKFYQ